MLICQFVPLSEFKNHYDLVTTELFGPFQIVTTFTDGEYDLLIETINSFKNHLSAGVVSAFIQPSLTFV